MEPIIEKGNDIITIIAEPGTLTFATRKAWEPLPEIRLSEMAGFTISLAFMGTSSVYFLLHQFYAPFDRDIENRYKLVKVKTDEEGKLEFFEMNVSAAECEQLKKYRLTLWD